MMLSVRNLTKQFRGHTAVDNFSIEVDAGEFIALLGPSGSGKTTVLRMVAGLLPPTSGDVYLGDRNVTRARPKDRQIGVVFQSYALFPHLSARDNVAFSLKVRRWSKQDTVRRVDELLDIMQLSHRKDYYPEQMSGGERQRVALARALAFNPPLLLLDEPLSALDAKVRVSLREMLKDVQRRLHVTAVLVTHDQEEALSLADRVIVMQSGRIEQIGAPEEVYHSPQTPFVSTFVGVATPIPVKAASDGSHDVRWGDYAFSWMLTTAQQRELASGTTQIYVRPEAVRLLPAPETGHEPQGEVLFSMFLGNAVRVRVRMSDETVLTADVAGGQAIYRAGQVVFVQLCDNRVSPGFTASDSPA